MNERTAMHEPERKSAGGIHGSFQHSLFYLFFYFMARGTEVPGMKVPDQASSRR